MHRGAAVTKGDPIYMIETIYADHSKCKIFPSLAGFKAGLRAVEDDLKRFGYVGASKWAPIGYRTSVIEKPKWKDFTP